MLAIECIAVRTLRAAEGHDVSWELVAPQPGVDYSNPESVTREAAWLELDADGERLYRVTEVGP